MNAATFLASLIVHIFEHGGFREKAHFTLYEILVNKRRFDEAIFEARHQIETCSLESLERAFTVLAFAIKAKDGSLARLHRYLVYQKYLRPGPDQRMGTEDDLPDPLADLLPPADERRDRIFETALKALARDWNGRMLRATVYLYWGRCMSWKPPSSWVRSRQSHSNR